MLAFGTCRRRIHLHAANGIALHDFVLSHFLRSLNLTI
jgi:hypothetical protein